MTRAVFFDVDFTLIHPGPDVPGRRLPGVLRAARHRRSTRRGSTRAVGRGLADAAKRGGGIYDPAIFIRYTRRDHRGDGRRGRRRWTRARKDIYDEWAACRHFTLYEEVPDVLRAIRARAASASG